jgi:type IV secretion system protein VirB3
MSGSVHHSAGGHVEGFEAPIHRSLGSPILLGGAPRGIAIVNGTLAAAVGLGLQQWLAGLMLWAAGHSLAVIAARRDPDFVPVLVRHLRQKGYLAC